MAARVYIALCKHERERVWENLKVYVKYVKIRPNSLERLHHVILKHWAVIFYFFYKTRLGNML